MWGIGIGLNEVVVRVVCVTLPCQQRLDSVKSTHCVSTIASAIRIMACPPLRSNILAPRLDSLENDPIAGWQYVVVVVVVVVVFSLGIFDDPKRWLSLYTE